MYRSDARKGWLVSEQTREPLDPEQLAQRVAVLEGISLFAGCRASDLRLLAAPADPIAIDAGNVLCAEGGDALDCYVITEGEAQVTIGGTSVATVGADEVVGGRGPIMDRPRAATVTATTHMISFADLMRPAPSDHAIEPRRC